MYSMVIGCCTIAEAELGKNKLSYDEVSPESQAMDVSIGNKAEMVEKEGIKIRGTGAATKGIKARGPMA